MPRSIWNGTITFGLISVPVKVNSATEDRSVHFHQVHAKDGARIKQKRMCSKENKEVPYKEVANGYEVGEGEYVLLSADEIAAAAGDRAHSIDLEEFVCAGQIDPVFYDRTYHLAVGDEGEVPYRLLHDALARAQRVGIGRWVFHNREYMVAVRPLPGAYAEQAKHSAGATSGGVLALHTMRFADELVEADDLELPEPSRAPTERELEMAVQLVDSLHERFRPEAFEDTHRERLLELIDRKAKGEQIDAEPPPAPEPTSDLMQALEASLAAGSKHGRGASRDSAAVHKSSAGRRSKSRARSGSGSGSGFGSRRRR